MNNLINTALIWKLAIFRLFLYCAGATIGCYQGAMHASHWRDLDGDDKFFVILGIASVNIGIIGAFIDKTIANMAQGDVLPPNVNDLVLSKVTETQKTPAVAATSTTPAVPEITETVVTTTTAAKAPEIKT